MLNTFVKVSKLGTAFFPQKYIDIYSGQPIRQFDLNKKSRNQPLKYLKQGGIPVLKGSWSEICSFYQDILKFQKELIPFSSDKRQRKLRMKQLQKSVLTKIDSLPQNSLQNFTLEELAGFIGESALPENIPTLIPIYDAQDILNISASSSYIDSLKLDIKNHPDVLAPKSQKTIDLMCKAIQHTSDRLPKHPRVLDMGCGSGILSIATYQLLKSQSPQIVATDILKEAIATAKLNIRHLIDPVELEMNPILTTSGGDLFEPVQGELFDLIIFNAPWVVAPAKNRAELALNDGSQRTIQRFFDECSQHLSPNGRVIVGYADNSGPKAIEKLEMYLADAGLIIHQIFKDRIKTYRSKGAWQSIYAYVLRKEN